MVPLQEIGLWSSLSCNSKTEAIKKAQIRSIVGPVLKRSVERRARVCLSDLSSYATSLFHDKVHISSLMGRYILLSSTSQALVHHRKDPRAVSLIWSEILMMKQHALLHVGLGWVAWGWLGSLRGIHSQVFGSSFDFTPKAAGTKHGCPEEWEVFGLQSALTHLIRADKICKR